MENLPSTSGEKRSKTESSSHLTKSSRTDSGSSTDSLISTPSTASPTVSASPESDSNDEYLTLTGGFKIPTVGMGTVFHEGEDVESAIDKSISIGYRHIDTAFMYQTEKAIGKVVRKWILSKKIAREEFFITSKLPFHGLHEEAVEPFLKESLKSLQLEYVDLYLVHFPVAFKYEGVDKYTAEPVETDHISVWKKMEEQVDTGRTKSIGLSNFNIKQIERIMKVARIKPSCVQIEMHVFFQQRELVSYCHNNKIVVVAYAPLGTPQFIKFQAQMEKKIRMPNLLENKMVQKIASKLNKTTAQILIRFLIQKKVCAIPKSTKQEHLRANIMALTFELNSEDMSTLEALDRGEKGRIVDMGLFFPGIRSHPEYPFTRLDTRRR